MNSPSATAKDRDEHREPNRVRTDLKTANGRLAGASPSQNERFSAGKCSCRHHASTEIGERNQPGSSSRCIADILLGLRVDRFVHHDFMLVTQPGRVYIMRHGKAENEVLLQKLWLRPSETPLGDMHAADSGTGESRLDALRRKREMGGRTAEMV